MPSWVSPRSRGSTPELTLEELRDRGFPALAGIDPRPPVPSGSLCRFPRARGDRPPCAFFPGDSTAVSPRSRGSTGSPLAGLPRGSGFPALAGIDPRWAACFTATSGFPRARGDRPRAIALSPYATTVSPRSRGSTLSAVGEHRLAGGFPALAGIDPRRRPCLRRRCRFPRARGDRPYDHAHLPRTLRVSPRSRGSTREIDDQVTALGGFPALAGIDPSWRSCASSASRFPRARGDRPETEPYAGRDPPVSPRSRGSTLEATMFDTLSLGFPALAGIDLSAAHQVTELRRFPRARGDRPSSVPPAVLRQEVSPRSRGSTRRHRLHRPGHRGFPALAGIDPFWAMVNCSPTRFPRARGDRPQTAIISIQSSTVSPRSRGSTFRRIAPARVMTGFPALAGIDLEEHPRPVGEGRFPRARGDRPRGLDSRNPLD